MKLHWTAIGGAAGLVVAIGATWPMLHAIGELGSARTALAALAAERAAPPPPPLLPDAGFTPATDPAGAGRAASMRIRRAAVAGGVLVETLAPAASAGTRTAVLRVSASGSERAVLAFADGIERGVPVLRWRRWRLASVPGGAVRVEGEVLVPWR